MFTITQIWVNGVTVVSSFCNSCVSMGQSVWVYRGTSCAFNCQRAIKLIMARGRWQDRAMVYGGELLKGRGIIARR